MSGKPKTVGLVIGGVPRVDLLPPEVRAHGKSKTLRRGLVMGVLGVTLLVILGVGGASFLALQSQSALAAEQARTTSLLSQQSKYVELRKMQSEATLIKAAQSVGASTEIDWKAFLDNIQATLPANVVVNTVTVDSATPLAIYEQPTAPLQGERIATVSFTATSPTLPEIPKWLTALSSLKGYSDANPDSVTLDTTTGSYTVTISMHVNTDAFDNRFLEKKEK